MKIIKHISLLAVSLLIVGGTACNKENPENTGNNPGTSVDNGADAKEIAGTPIDEKNNIFGQVTDSKTGKGIAGVPVSDGYHFAVTDANGVYQFAADLFSRIVYIVVPSEYEIPLDDKNSPGFYSKTPISRKQRNRNDFKLTPLAAPQTNWTFIGIGDPQCKTDANRTRFETETIPDLQATANNYPNCYAVTLGDITHDQHDQYVPMSKSLANVKTNYGYLPIFNCIGNHDHNYDFATDSDYATTATYVENYGPTDYSFNRGDVHIVVMDDVVLTGKGSNTCNYVAGFDDQQYEWFKKDLELVKDKANKMLFFCAHIPFRGSGSETSGASVNNKKHYSDFLKLMTQFKEAHIMIGHTHYSQNWIHKSYKCKNGQFVYEHIHGAACGGWWSCDSDVIGGPAGYNIYEIEGATIKNWHTKGTGRTKDFQMRVYDGNQTYSGAKGYVYNWYNTANKGGSGNITAKGNTALKNAFVAQVWDDDDTYWTLEMYKGDEKVGDFKRLANGSCTNVCITSYFFNELGKNTDTWASTTASHYWYFVPESGGPSSEKGWTVVATQKIPSSGEVNRYTCSTLTTDYSTF